MKVSVNTLKDLLGFELPAVEELVRRINAQLGGVEEVVDLSAKYKGIIIVKVVECVDHPDSDHLRVCKVDDGGVAKDVERDDQGLVQVVCGAPNIAAGQFVVWLPPGSTVPASYDDADPFVLGARNLRGVMSNGMIASARELAIGDDHEGIVVLTEKDVSSKPDPQSGATQLASGLSFAETFGLDDTIIDIENKMFTHRPDLFGQLGVAREIAGIFRHDFNDPEWYYQLTDQSGSDALPLTVFNEAGDNVPRLMFVAMQGATIAPSPMWLQTTLVRWGGKPINNVVDITNYVMLLTAQPTHAYDYDKLRGATIGARMATPGEKLPLLNGKTYELVADDIVIADGEGAIGLGGIMGGGNSEVSPETTRIVLEVANFDMYAVRKSAMRHGLFTDALTRFNKGQSMLMNPYVMQKTVEMLSGLTGAEIASKKFDDLMADETNWRAKPAVTPMLQPAKIDTAFINDRLGLRLNAEEIMGILTHVGFECNPEASGFTYWAPAWRMDIQESEDVVEEIGRLYGFDKLPQELPARSIVPAPKNSNFEMRRKIGQILSGVGSNEVKTYSFVHERVLKNAGQNTGQAFRLSNALSPDLQYYRLSLAPSLLDKVHMNIKAGHDYFALYEFGKAHNKKEFDNDGTPREVQALAYVYAAKKPQSGAAYYRALRALNELLDQNNITSLKLDLLEELDLHESPWLEQTVAPFDPKRSAVLRAIDDSLTGTKGQILGVVGEFKQSVCKSFKLPAYSAGFEVDPTMFAEKTTKSYMPLSRFPHVTQDISLRVSEETTYGDVLAAAKAALDPEQSTTLHLELKPLGIYKPAEGGNKTITLRLKAVNYERTLTDTEVTKYLDLIAETAGSKYGAVKV